MSQVASGPVRAETSTVVAERKISTLYYVREHVKTMFHLAPHVLSMVIVTAHASHITEVFSHISGKQMVLSGAIFALWYITNSGSEEL